MYAFGAVGGEEVNRWSHNCRFQRGFHVQHISKFHAENCMHWPGDKVEQRDAIMKCRNTSDIYMNVNDLNSAALCRIQLY